MLDHVTLGRLATEEPLWWMKTMKLYNGRKIQQQEPHIIIQRDASPKPELHTAREF